MNHNIPPPPSWQPFDVLNIPQCTHDIPHMYHSNPLMYSWECIKHPLMYRTYIIQGGSTAPRTICKSNKKEDTQENYATLDWLSTRYGLSQNLCLLCNVIFFSLPCNVMFFPSLPDVHIQLDNEYENDRQGKITSGERRGICCEHIKYH